MADGGGEYPTGKQLLESRKNTFRRYFEREVLTPTLESQETYSKALRERILFQESVQNTCEDERVCLQIGKEVGIEIINSFFQYLPEYHYSDLMNLFLVSFQGTLLSDLGKTGPLHATKKERALISKIYAVETPFPVPPHKLSMRDFLILGQETGDPFFAPHTLDGHLKTLEDMGIAHCNVREFLNLHAQWTFDILEQETDIPFEVKLNAGLHHLLEGVIPVYGGEPVLKELPRRAHASDPHPTGSDLFFTHLPLPREGDKTPNDHEKLLSQVLITILLDKYQARRRFSRSHEEQIAWLRNYLRIIKLHERYPLLAVRAESFITAIDAVGPFSSLFAKEEVAIPGSYEQDPPTTSEPMPNFPPQQSDNHPRVHL